MSFARETINNDVLIREVEVRPGLYNRDLKEYNDLSIKKRMWEEIAAILFPMSWAEMTIDQKERAVNNVQKRWKNLRACYTRELRNRKYGKEPKRRKYIYFDKLRFLKHSVEQFEIIDKDESEENEDFKEEYECSIDSIKEDTIEIPVNLPNTRKQRNAETQLLEFVQAERQEESFSTRDFDPDTNFSLSLVPMLKMIPMRRKIDAQISILQVLRNSMYERKSKQSAVKTEIEMDSDDD